MGFHSFVIASLKFGLLLLLVVVKVFVEVGDRLGFNLARSHTVLENYSASRFEQETLVINNS